MRVLLTAFLIASAALPATAQKFGPAENLGPAIPTPQYLVDRMLEAGRVKPGGMVYGLGSRGGRVVITAAHHFLARAASASNSCPTWSAKLVSASSAWDWPTASASWKAALCVWT